MLASGFVSQRGTSLSPARAGSTKAVSFPAPRRGLDAVSPLANMSPDSCVLALNMIPDGRGMRVRSGFAEFAVNTATSNSVNTLIPFQGSVPAQDRLFGVTQVGIYNFTGGGAASYTAALTFPSTQPLAGIGVWTDYVLDNGQHYAFYADEAHGLHRYIEGGSWTAVTDITGVDELNLVFCMQHKGRMWFVERNSGRAWYLAPGAIAGAATRFDFGNKFRHGGDLRGLWTWTIDGGSGPDDYLVAVSGGGDVMVYQGTDPASASTWNLVGQYYIGAIPEGRRIAASQGGELFLLSQYGLLPMSKLLSGRTIEQQDIYASAQITPLITNEMALTRTQRGWEVKNIPSENVLLIATPKRVGFPYKQFAMSTKTNGWCFFESLEYLTGETWRGSFYIGGEASTVFRMTGNRDDVLLSNATGQNIKWALLTAFTDFGEPSRFHRAQFVRTVFRAASAPSLDIEARYDYNTDDPIPLPIAGATGGALWDSAIWDNALWGGDAITFSNVFGVHGIGVAVAVAISGSSSSETNLIRVDLMADTGGML